MVPNQQSGGNDEAEHIHKRQLKEQLENRVRIKRGEILDRKHRMGELERQTSAIEAALHHMEQDHRRISEEVRRMELEVKQGVGVEKQAEMNLRDTTQELHLREDKMRKLEHEIDLLKKEIEGKEHLIAELKDEERALAHTKEEHRRTGELEHFTVKSGGEHVHEREVKLTILGHDIIRHQNDLNRLKQEEQDLKRDMSMREQDLMQLEAELQKAQH